LFTIKRSIEGTAGGHFEIKRADRGQNRLNPAGRGQFWRFLPEGRLTGTQPAASSFRQKSHKTGCAKPIVNSRMGS